MADLARTGTNGSRVAAVTETKPHMRFFRVGEDFEQGMPGYLRADGLVMQTDANGTSPIAADSASNFVGAALGPISSGESGSFLWDGSLGGYDLSAQDYGDKIFLSDTKGAFADAAGTTSATVGVVLPLSDRDKTKVLYIKADFVRGNAT